MKHLLVTATFLFGTAAMACPNLSGTFSCPSTDENGNDIQIEKIISQSVQNGITYYSEQSVDGEFEMPADGSLYTFNFKNEETGNDVNLGVSLTCKGNTTDQYISQQEVDSKGTQVDFVDGNFVRSINSAGALVEDMAINYQGQTFKEQSVCTRIK